MILRATSDLGCFIRIFDKLNKCSKTKNKSIKSWISKTIVQSNITNIEFGLFSLWFLRRKEKPRTCQVFKWKNNSLVWIFLVLKDIQTSWRLSTLVLSHLCVSVVHLGSFVSVDRLLAPLCSHRVAVSGFLVYLRSMNPDVHKYLRCTVFIRTSKSRPRLGCSWFWSIFFKF